MEKIIRFFSALDWLVASSTLVVGIYLSNPWICAMGAFGLLMAYLQPAKKLQATIAKRFVRKRDDGQASTAQAAQDDAFYAEILEQVKRAPDDSVPVRTLPPRTFASPALAPVTVRLSTNKHNMLKKEHLNLASITGKTEYF